MDELCGLLNLIERKLRDTYNDVLYMPGGLTPEDITKINEMVQSMVGLNRLTGNSCPTVVEG